MNIRPLIYLIPVTLFCWTVAPGGHAQQPRSKLSAKFVYEMAADFKDGRQTADGSAAGVQVNEFELKTGFPIYMSEALKVFSGLEATWVHFSIDDLVLSDLDVYHVAIPLSLAMPLTETIRLRAGISPGLYTDGNYIDEDDVKVGVNALFFWQARPELTVAAGAVYSRVFGRDELFPAAGLVWNPADAWQVNLIYPTPAISYKVTDRLKLRIGMIPSGGQWNIQQSLDSGNDRNMTFSFSGWRLGTGVQYDINEHFMLDVYVGGVVGRSYEYEEDGDTVLDVDVEDTLAVQVALHIL